MKITITFPALEKWKNSRKVKLTRHQAMVISAMLENHRWSLHEDEAWERNEIRKAEDVLDTELWGKKYMEGRA